MIRAMNTTDKNIKQEDLTSTFSEEVRSGVIPVFEEKLHVSKEVVETGKLQISKKVLSEPADFQVSLFSENLSVKTVEINEYVEGETPRMRVQGDTTIIPVLKEVVIKRLLLVEEIHIIRSRTEENVSIQEVLRKEEVSINRIATEYGQVSPDAQQLL
jgi:uncharacterized protein (TIGR02271 family)